MGHAGAVGSMVTQLARSAGAYGYVGVDRRAKRGSALDGHAVDFVVEPNRAQLSEIVDRVRDGRLRTNIGTVSSLDDAVAALNPTERRPGKTIIRVRA